jgi:TolA-binding protein
MSGSSPTEESFRAGYALLRANNHAAAAVELGKAADGDGPLASDARYFQAIALTKAGRGAEAERALVAFLDRAPTSVRRGRAAVMLARRLVGRGDPKSARAWFESALGDADPTVAAAARAGLDSL